VLESDLHVLLLAADPQAFFSGPPAVDHFSFIIAGDCRRRLSEWMPNTVTNQFDAK
jgi:hypothetical protein